MSDTKQQPFAEALGVRRSSTKSEQIKGEFFGTDFNFLYSEEMQKAFATNCLSYNWD